MDARDRLRRYLEQRRELGESELVLDGMNVDDVMALLGARQSSRSPRAAPAPVSAMAPPETPMAPRRDETAAPDVPEVVAPPAPAPRFDSSVSGDWRQTLSQSNPQTPPASNATARAGAGAAPPQPAANASVAAAEVALLPNWLVSL